MPSPRTMSLSVSFSLALPFSLTLKFIMSQAWCRRAVKTVLLSVRIEMRSRGLEVWAVAFRVLMKMNGVHARRQVVQV